MNIECQNCHTDKRHDEVIFLCRICYSQRINKMKNKLINELEACKKECRKLERENDKLRSMVYTKNG